MSRKARIGCCFAHLSVVEMLARFCLAPTDQNGLKMTVGQNTELRGWSLVDKESEKKA